MRIPSSGGGNTEPEPDRLALGSGGRAAGSESEWRQLPRSSLSTGLRAAEPADFYVCAELGAGAPRGGCQSRSLIFATHMITECAGWPAFE